MLTSLDGGWFRDESMTQYQVVSILWRRLNHFSSHCVDDAWGILYDVYNKNLNGCKKHLTKEAIYMLWLHGYV